MFNRKKREIERLNTRLQEEIERFQTVLKTKVELNDAKHELVRKHEEDLRTIRQLNKEKGELLRELANEREKTEQLRHLLEAANDQTSQSEAGKRSLQGENRALREKIEEAKRHTECPADCVHRTSPNSCRTCIRYPKAKDKYEVGIDA